MDIHWPEEISQANISGKLEVNRWVEREINRHIEEILDNLREPGSCVKSQRVFG